MTTGKRLIEKITPYAKRLESVAHLYRLSIIYLLAHDPMEVRDITDALGIAENLVSHHLKQLALGGWVLKTKFGRRVTYRINEKAIGEMQKLFVDTPLYRELFKK